MAVSGNRLNQTGQRAFGLMIAGLTMAATSYGLARYGYGLFLPRIRVEFTLSTEMLGFIASATYLGYIMATLLGSALSSRLGPRLPIVMGGLCATLGMGLIAGSESLTLFITGSIIAGLSPGLSYTPLSDAVVMMIQADKRDRVYAVANSGTSLGVLISGPIAFFASNDWRLAWAAFALFALATTLWNAKAVDKGILNPHRTAKPSLRLLRPGALPLFSFAILLGVSSAAYWTYSVDFLQSSPVPVQLLGLDLPAADFSLIFWSLVGIAGFAAGFAGELVRILGLTLALRLGASLLVAALLLLVLFPDHGAILTLSAMSFGAVFTTLAGFLGIWTIQVFYDRPSGGFGASFLILSIGQFLGPSLYGIVAGQWDMQAAFYLAAVIGALMLVTRPVQDIRSMTPQSADNT